MKPDPFELALYIRRVEEFVAKKAEINEIPLPIHLSIGQELMSVAIILGFSDKDYIWGTYRSHGLYIGRTKCLLSFFSEILGKVDGCNSGFGGSMHLRSEDHRILGASGIVGTHIPNAVGFAYGKKLKKDNSITCVIFGDGATDAGTFYDSLNISQLYDVPILFFLEDNDLAIRTKKDKRHANNSIIQKIKSFGVNVFESQGFYSDTFKCVKDAKQYIKNSSKPAIVISKTIRWYQHLGFEYELNKTYRDFEKEDKILKNDEINVWLSKKSKISREKLEEKINKEINLAWKQSLKSNYPSLNKMNNNIK